mgnify:CR=1 FL=1
MKDYIEKRAIDLANYIIEHNATVRQAAKEFDVSKSTVHKDVTERLEKLSPVLYPQVREILEENKRERHIRGGLATKLKYEKLAVMHQEEDNKHKKTPLKNTE